MNLRKLFGFILMLLFPAILIIPVAWVAFGGGWFPFWNGAQWVCGLILGAIFGGIGMVIYIGERA